MLKILMGNALYFLVFFLVFVAGCGRRKVPTLQVPEYSSLKNMSEAPPKIQEASQAVVKISSGKLGTGFFISEDGLLMTNNHVLGATNCALQGCYVDIHFDYQIGKKFKPSTRLFAIPKGMDPNVDAAVYQMYHEDKSAKFKPAFFVQFENKTPAQLLHQTLYVVGHPAGHLKKWSKGEVTDSRGNLFTVTSTFILGGNSGSPHFTEDGKVVGILHHGTSGHGRLRPHGVNVFSIGTASSALIPLVQGNGRNSNGREHYFSIEATHTKQEVVDHESVYFSSHQKSAKVGGADLLVFDILGEACDAGLKLPPDRLGTEDLINKSIEACEAGHHWIECNAEIAASHESCPVGAEKTKWISRNEKVAERLYTFMQKSIFHWVSTVNHNLESEYERGLVVGRERLDQFLQDHRPTLSFELANYKLAFADSKTRAQSSYEGRNLVEFVSNWKTRPGYHEQYDWIIASILRLHTEWNLLTKEELRGKFREIFQDRKLSLDDKLLAESAAYENELF